MLNVFGPLVSFIISFSLISFSNPFTSAIRDVPNQGLGRLVDFNSKGKARQVLLTARQRRHREATPEHKVEHPPKLISAKDLAILRRDVAPVSFRSSFSHQVLTSSIFLS